MSNEKLTMFLAERVRSGMKKAEIKEQLAAVGWSEDEVDAAYAQALVESGVPVPEGSARGAFSRKASTVDIMIGFFSFILLGIVTFALGSLFFNIIEWYFPDSLSTVAWGLAASSEAMHYSIAALLIGFPLYFFAVRLWFRRFREDDGRIESRLTKWVTYVVLLAAAVAIVGDLITTLFTFLQGEMSVRFFLKAITVLGIAGMIFNFYFLERKKIQYRHDIPRRVFQFFGWGLFGMVSLGIILGFIVAGSPATQRERTFDARRSNDLGELAGCVNGYAQDFSALPDTLSDLEKSTNFSYCFRLRDPETGASYEYRLIKNFDSTRDGSEAQFELCAVFSLESGEIVGAEMATMPSYDSPLGSQNGKWSAHGSGRSCDVETVVLKRNVQY